MARSLMFILILFLAAPALAGPRVQVYGDPRIDAQWTAQLGHARSDAARRMPEVRQDRPSKRAALAPRRRAVEAVQPRLRTIDPAFLPAIVDYTTAQKAGTIVIDPQARYLYLVLEGGKAQRYGVGVGRDGFGWAGAVRVGRKAEWPTWTPPAEMRQRQPYLPVSMPGGPKNPLGARALYLYDNGRDTLFRIHGSNEPWTIGHAVSSGCFRMRNEDVTALYGRVGIGTTVVVL